MRLFWDKNGVKIENQRSKMIVEAKMIEHR